MFPSIDQLQQHVAEEHLESFPEDLLDTVAFWPSTPVVGLEGCPLCYSTGPTDDPELIEHVLKHTHDFALRSLPWADDLPVDAQPPGTNRFNTNYLASSEPKEEHVSVSPWRMSLWFEQLEIPELNQQVWARSLFDTDKMTTWSTNPSLDRSLDYFSHNVYFDLQEKDKSLGVEDQSDDSEASTIVTTLSRSVDGSDEIGYTYEGDGLLSLSDGDDQATLCTLLQRYRIEGSDGPFWTEKLLRQILTERRVGTELCAVSEFSRSEVQYYLGKILSSKGQEEPETYLRVFTLLVLTARVCDVGIFIKEHCLISISDGEESALRCFRGWPLDQKRNFLQTQRHLIFPFLDVAAHNTCKAIVLKPDIIRPWRYESIRNSTGCRMGAFGTVSSVEIYPTSHAFDKALSEKNLKCELFAIKSLRRVRANKLVFEEELHKLGQLINGLSSHLVPILEAFQHDGHWSLILPHSNCSLRHLLQYGDSNLTPARTKWACLQLYGITDAISKIHSPFQDNAPHFAMHNGIDLDNILCYGRPDSPEQCVLVVSHFPMSSPLLGSESEISVDGPITCSPTYRPPEWDIQGGGMSNYSDIWSLGCVYLVFLTWLLKGWEEVLLFENLRSSPHIDGTRSDRFYTFTKFYNRDTYVLRVKSQVMAQIQGLECHEKCSRAIRRVLSLIKSRMLLVLSVNDLRSSSSSLRASFERICEARHKASYYGAPAARPPESFHAISAPAAEEAPNSSLKQAPRPRSEIGLPASVATPPQTSHTISPPAVEVNLSSSLRQTMRPGSDSGLPIYAGQAHKSLW
ncbi:Protein kinase domain-containing protein [Fusarium sp. LHS14.1]|nr:Protein kinase domain-containing protein [Fusarium sp. LHS14.1]